MWNVFDIQSATLTGRFLTGAALRRRLIAERRRARARRSRRRPSGPDRLPRRSACAPASDRPPTGRRTSCLPESVCPGTGRRTLTSSIKGPAADRTVSESLSQVITSSRTKLRSRSIAGYCGKGANCGDRSRASNNGCRSTSQAVTASRRSSRSVTLRSSSPIQPHG